MSERLSSQDQIHRKKFNQARERVIRSIATNIDLYGIPSSIGRLYGTMFFHDEPMTLDEMSSALGMSKTSMSTGVRSLLDIKMVHKTFQKGVRKDLYLVEEDWYNSFIHLFTSKWGRAIEYNENAISTSIRELEEISEHSSDEELKQEVRQDLDKLEHAMEYYTWLKQLVKSFETGDIFKFIPKPGTDRS